MAVYLLILPLQYPIKTQSFLHVSVSNSNDSRITIWPKTDLFDLHIEKVLKQVQLVKLKQTDGICTDKHAYLQAHAYKSMHTVM